MITAEPHADSTTDKILTAATALFIDKGFDATPVSRIAQHAGVTQSLIFHHFSSKAELWVRCKQRFLDAHPFGNTAGRQQAGASLNGFIEWFITKRFRFYQNNPTYVRFMAWQCVSQSSQSLLSACQKQSTTDAVIDLITGLQQQRLINNTYSPQCILAFIANLTNGYFIKNLSSWMTGAQEQAYLNMVETQVRQLLKP